jgi:hypothetical protein
MPRKNPNRTGLKRPQMICDSCGEPVDELYPDPRYKNHLPINQKFCCFECKKEIWEKEAMKCPKVKNTSAK